MSSFSRLPDSGRDILLEIRIFEYFPEKTQGMVLMEFEKHLLPSELQQFQNLRSPLAIQEYLDSIPYVGEDLNRSPLRVMRDAQCHCLDGAILAALALSRIGYKPFLIDLVPEAGLDDDHVLAIFKEKSGYGAVAKSNFVGLRFREPVYRSLRELAMSYFEDFYNIDGLKTLRGYTRTLNLSRFDPYDWATQQSGVDKVTNALYRLTTIPLIDQATARNLTQVDRRSYEAGMLGTNYDGLYKPAVGMSGEWTE